VGISAEVSPARVRSLPAGQCEHEPQHGGLGLGLAITRHLVELQGGRIFAASDGPTPGATFRIVLPARTCLRPKGRRRRINHLPAAVVPELRGLRILAVDDDRDALTLVRESSKPPARRLRRPNRHPRPSRDRVERVRRDADRPGHAGVNGFELIARVRRSDRLEIRKIPAAALTAYARSEDRSKALRSGFQNASGQAIDPAS